MSYFPLKYRATVTRQTTTTDRSGQEVVSGYDTVEECKCLFLTTSGNKRIAMREDFEAVVAFYTEVTVDLREGDRIINISDRSGSVIEPGPFEVLSVKKVAGLSGKVHHLSAKLKGLG